MSKLKLAELQDDTPVKLTIDLPGEVHRDLVAYAEALNGEGGRRVDPAKLVVLMLARFMNTDRAFIRYRRRPAPPRSPPDHHPNAPTEMAERPAIGLNVYAGCEPTPAQVVSAVELPAAGRRG